MGGRRINELLKGTWERIALTENRWGPMELTGCSESWHTLDGLNDLFQYCEKIKLRNCFLDYYGAFSIFCLNFGFSAAAASDLTSLMTIAG